jgi:hypothetical protein
MSRLKKEILSKLKEYAGKMGKDHLGGDDSPSPKRGGLRDFDGYDNVDYNQDMPMDEDSPESAHPQGSKKLTNRTTVMDMLDVISHKEFGPDYHKLSTKQKKEVHKLAIKGKLIKQSPFKESVVTEAKDNLYLQLHKKYAKQIKGLKAKKIKKLTDLVSVQRWSMEDRKDYFGMDSKKKKELSKEYDTERKLFKKYIGGDESVMLPKGTEKLSESLNEGKVDRVVGHTRYKYIGDGRKGQAIVSGPMKDREKEAIIKRAKKAGYSAKPNMGGGVTIHVESLNEGFKSEYKGNDGIIWKKGKTRGGVTNFTPYYKGNDIDKGGHNFKTEKELKDFIKDYILSNQLYKKYSFESVNESMFSAIDQIRQDSKDVRDFVKNVFKDREFKKMSTDKEFIKYLKSIYEGINEAIPQNFHQGRTSDYHTALRGKNRDYSGGTNFKKKNHGQPDVEEDDEDQETNQLSNKQIHVKAKLKVAESGKKKSEKNYKDWKSTNEGFDKIEHLSLLNKALRAIPGSKKQKDIIRQLNVIRKAGGMRPLKELSIVEYGQRLDLSFIEDEEAKLDGTYPSTDAIDRDIDESLKDMVGDTYTFSIGSGDEKWIKPNTKEYVIEKIAETIKHNLYDWDFSLNGIDGSQAKEYSKIFDNDVLKPLLRNIDKTLKTYFKIDSKNKKISWKLSFRDNDKIIDAFFKKNKKISSDIRDSYFSQNEVAKRDYKDEYKKFQSSTKSKKYRAELNKYNRDKGTYGNGDGKDASHKGGKIVGFESESKNRGRAEKSRLKKK